MGGPPAVLLYFSSPTTVGVSRASIIGYFLGLDAISAALTAAHGLYTREVGLWVLALALPMFAGTVLGNRQFLKADPERFRRFVILLLAVLSSFVVQRLAFRAGHSPALIRLLAPISLLLWLGVGVCGRIIGFL